MIAFYDRDQLRADPALEHEYFQFRHEVFSAQLGWRPMCPSGVEQDQFDLPRCKPVYAIGQNSLGMVTATWRIIEASCPHMLSDVFTNLQPDPTVQRPARSWELSRFAVNGKAIQHQGLNGINVETARLVAATIARGLSQGVDEVFVVAEARILRVMRMIGCKADWMGATQIIAGHQVQAAGFILSEPFLRRVEAHCEYSARIPCPDHLPLPSAA